MKNKGGRPKGAKSKRNKRVDLLADANRQLEKRLKRGLTQQTITPLEYLLAIMRSPRALTKRRDWAAAQAAQYLHFKPRAPEDEKSRGIPPVVYNMPNIQPAEKRGPEPEPEKTPEEAMAESEKATVH